MNTIIQRMQKPTPKFFQKLRNIGLMITAIAATVLTAPVSLPSVVVTIAGYLAVAGTVATAVSQTAVTGEEADPVEQFQAVLNS